MHILIVEDEQKIAAFIKRGLTEKWLRRRRGGRWRAGIRVCARQENGSHHSRCRAAQA